VVIIKRPTVIVNHSAQAEVFHCVATYVPIRRWPDVVRAFRLSTAVEKQIRTSEGAVAYSLAVDLLKRRFWTCSVWTGEAAIAAFVRSEPHATAIARYEEWAAEGAAFVEWKSVERDPDWANAFDRLRGATPATPGSAK
jgi:hypothetical protein